MCRDVWFQYHLLTGRDLHSRCTIESTQHRRRTQPAVKAGEVAGERRRPVTGLVPESGHQRHGLLAIVLDPIALQAAAALCLSFCWML
jgi:hypothetical protein